MDAEVEINSAWERIRENSNFSQKESELLRIEKDNPWFDAGCSRLLYQRKQAKFYLLQDPSEVDGDNLNNVRFGVSRHFTNKMREYLKDKINELASSSKNKNIRDHYRGINEFKRGYQPRNNLVKDENGDFLADFNNILNRWKNYFFSVIECA
jgi:hypothetical protein